MALNNLGLGFVFTAQNLGKATFRGVQRDLQQTAATADATAVRVQRSMGQLKTGFLLAAAGAIGVGISFGLAGAAGKFEQGIAAVGAVSKATTEELKLLEATAIQAGIATQFSPTEAVEGLTSLATAGQNATQATRTLIPVLDLAAGSLGQLGVAGAAEAVVGTLNSYGLAAENAGSVTDRLLKITQLTNFQARDFGVGLAKAAAAGSQFGQSLDDVLITVGQLRNANIDASSAATAFRESVRRLGSDQRAQAQLTEKGVDIFDKLTGKMRPLLDISLDFAEATKDMTDKERQRRLAISFGARGMLAFNAITRSSIQVTRDGAKVTLKGAEAIAELRRQLAEATGTAEDFRNKLLDTFEGQKTLLSGTLQTAAVVFGAPFARIFKPMVKVVTDTINAVVSAFENLSKPIQDVIAQIIFFGSSAVLVTGIVLLIKAGIALLGVTLAGFVAMIGAALIALKPLLIALAVVVVAFKAFRFAYENNLGGFADFVGGIVAKVKLFFGALVQVFSQGGFSGAIREELNAGNEGIKGFAITAFLWFNRIKAFVVGLGEGFTSAIEGMEPAFGALIEGLREIGKAFGITFSGPGDPDKNRLAFQRFSEVAVVLGKVLGRVAGVLAIAVAGALRIVAFGIRNLRILWDLFVSTFRPGVRLVLGLMGVMADIVRGDFSSAWESFKDTIIDVLKAIWSHIKLIASPLVKIIRVMMRVMAVVGAAIEKGIAKSIGLVTSAVSKVSGFFGVDLGSPEAVGDGGAAPTATTPTNSSLPAAEAVAIMERFAPKSSEPLPPQASAPPEQVVRLEIDGETLAEVSTRGNKSLAGRSFAPVPTV